MLTTCVIWALLDIWVQQLTGDGGQHDDGRCRDLVREIVQCRERESKDRERVDVDGGRLKQAHGRDGDQADDRGADAVEERAQAFVRDGLLEILVADDGEREGWQELHTASVSE